MTLATILDTVLDETGFAKPSSYFGGTAEASVRARALANASARDLVNIRHRDLIKTHTINMTTDTTYPLPADWHAFVQDTMYEDSQPVNFPATDQQFALINASGIGDGALVNVRIVGGQFEIDEPNNGEAIQVMYRSNHPIQATGGGATKAEYTADTDEWLLDDRLHTYDIIWRWKKLHGMDYQDDLALYKRYERHYLARDGGYRSLNFNQGAAAHRGGPTADLWV
jgi:hypothetical protein